MRNRQLESRTDVENAFRAFFDLKTADFYKRGIYKLEMRWQKVIEANGNYFCE